jgi:hypothetical protein
MSEQTSALICDGAEAKIFIIITISTETPHALHGFVGGVLGF